MLTSYSQLLFPWHTLLSINSIIVSPPSSHCPQSHTACLGSTGWLLSCLFNPFLHCSFPSRSWVIIGYKRNPANLAQECAIVLCLLFSLYNASVQVKCFSGRWPLNFLDVKKISCLFLRNAYLRLSPLTKLKCFPLKMSFLTLFCFPRDCIVMFQLCSLQWRVTSNARSSCHACIYSSPYLQDWDRYH